MARVNIKVFVGVLGALAGLILIQEKDTTPYVDPSRIKSASAASASATATPAVEPAPEEGVPDSSAGAKSVAEPTAAPLDSDPDDIDDGAGGDSPSLDGAPKSVRFAAIIVHYDGAQGVPEGARSKAEAKGLAQEIENLAREDWRAAVKKGDKGSTRDAGVMYRGIMEPDVEYALFSLEKQQVSDPVDSPRGFIIFKRLK
ncbi:MAG: peptidyl-prolyl cis-trans isomerase [Myxococcota bacterium]